MTRTGRRDRGRGQGDRTAVCWSTSGGPAASVGRSQRRRAWRTRERQRRSARLTQLNNTRGRGGDSGRRRRSEGGQGREQQCEVKARRTPPFVAVRPPVGTDVRKLAPTTACAGLAVEVVSKARRKGEQEQVFQGFLSKKLALQQHRAAPARAAARAPARRAARATAARAAAAAAPALAAAQSPARAPATEQAGLYADAQSPPPRRDTALRREETEQVGTSAALTLRDLDAHQSTVPLPVKDTHNNPLCVDVLTTTRCHYAPSDDLRNLETRNGAGRNVGRPASM